MRTKKFNNEIIVRPLLKSDLLIVQKFQNFINSLVKEKAMLSTVSKMTLKKETAFLNDQLKKIKSKKIVYLVAEDKKKELIAGTVSVRLQPGAQDHVGNLGITVRKEYRRIGLGKVLMREIVGLAKKELKPRPEIIRLSVFHANEPALKLYKKIGFKKAARIPRQFRHRGELMDEVVMMKEL